MAESCSRADRRLGAAAWRGLQPLARGPLPAVLDLGATPLERFESPAALAGAAGAAQAAGNRTAAGFSALSLAYGLAALARSV